MPSEAKCARIFRKLRWADGIKCPRCGSGQVTNFCAYREHLRRFRCKHCHRSFTDMTGTIFEDSNMALNEWFYITRELQRGMSINQISKELGRGYRHVMNAAHKIMDSVFMKRLVDMSAEDIEIDEMYQSAGEKGKKQTTRNPRKRGLKLRGRGTYAKDKPPIVTVVGRGGNAVMEVFRTLNKKNLDAFLYLVTGRFVHTDDYRIYDHLDESDGCIHESTCHSKKQYAQAYKHSNTVEGMFCDLRTWLRTYKGVCKENMHRFVSMFQFNYNHRMLNPFDAFSALLSTSFVR
jgi:transposase-like protein